MLSFEKMQDNFTFEPISELAFTVRFGSDLNLEILNKVLHFKRKLDKYPFEYYSESVNAYNTVTIFINEGYYLKHQNIDWLKNEVEKLYILDETVENNQNKLIKTIDVYYTGADLEYVSRHLELSVEKIIELHIKPIYTVAMIGFLPGFPYLMGLDSSLILARKTTPTTNVKAGSVAIGGKQTGIYTLDSPGGWYTIGYTSLQLFNINNDKPTALEAGDLIKFNAV